MSFISFRFQVIVVCCLIAFTVNLVECDKDPLGCQIIVDRGAGFTFCVFSKVNATDRDTTKIKAETTMFQGRLIESEQVSAVSFAFSNFDLIPSEVFNNFGDVSRLKFYGGHLKIIRKESFANASHLRLFEVSDSKIDEISSQAFKGAENLEKIVLENSSIGKIFDDAFDGLTKLKFLSLKKSNYTDMAFISNLPKSVELIDIF